MSVTCCLPLCAVWILLGAAVATATEAPAAASKKTSNVHGRSDFSRARDRFEKTKKGHVAFIGGSITEMEGYRPLLADWLKERFPDTEFTVTAAGISSTCSTTGAFRLERDVLSQGPVDLFFVEFAVNDDQDAHHTREECIRGLEGILRHTLLHHPQAEIVVTYFVNPDMRDALTAGKTPVPIAAHEKVARHYGVSSVNLAKEVAERIQRGDLTWETYGGTHPKLPGNRLAADLIIDMLSQAWQGDAPATPTPAAPLPAMLDEASYAAGRFVSPAEAKFTAPWQLHTPDWKKLPGSCRGRFLEQKLLCADQAGAEFSLAFEGRAIGAYLLAGPDAGAVEASIDGGPFEKFDLYHHYSKGLHYPRTVMFADELEPGTHSLRLRIAADKNPASSGHAVRILQFTAN
ncbi:SGNH/GDSL hydrolase family protein [Lignipirellula cremea]|uniref:SGNH hydrolase-type esterase domain-containing protein n=1 Tax=Lignipirellula cremea TaxID=2528010 RepID=A0A518DZM9_9BACT|nr:SGNH/GDSL hydrolase family protein [Lignipirellula cremea]QDU97297.1 hypothetical protein Pla8534_51430 [Lignipirellula cremea]